MYIYSRNHNPNNLSFYCIFRGELKIAEVVSRIEDLKVFTKGIERLGFKMKSKDTSNKMFVLMDFTKVSDSPASSKQDIDTLDQDALIPKLKPCIYKRR